MRPGVAARQPGEGVIYLPAVVGVAVIGDHRLRLLFDDGTAGDVDLSGMQWKGVFEPLGDAEYFAKVKLDPEAATVVWPNGADLAPETLYAEAKKHPLIAA